MVRHVRSTHQHRDSPLSPLSSHLLLSLADPSDALLHLHRVIVTDNGHIVGPDPIKSGSKAGLIRLEAPIVQDHIVSLIDQHGGTIQSTERWIGLTKSRLSAVQDEVVGVADENPRHKEP